MCQRGCTARRRPVRRFPSSSRSTAAPGRRWVAVLQTTIRAPRGYGNSYQRLIQRDWGGGDLKDWDHAVKWLHAQEWVDADRIGVWGGSYGGFPGFALG